MRVLRVHLKVRNFAGILKSAGFTVALLMQNFAGTLINDEYITGTKKSADFSGSMKM